jgi:hypothetical protein
VVRVVSRELEPRPSRTGLLARRLRRHTLALGILSIVLAALLIGTASVPVAHAEQDECSWTFVETPTVTSWSYEVNFTEVTAVTLNWSELVNPQQVNIKILDMDGNGIVTDYGLAGAASFVAKPGSYTFSVETPIELSTVVLLTSYFAYTELRPLVSPQTSISCGNE